MRGANAQSEDPRREGSGTAGPPLGTQKIYWTRDPTGGLGALGAPGDPGSWEIGMRGIGMGGGGEKENT